MLLAAAGPARKKSTSANNPIAQIRSAAADLARACTQARARGSRAGIIVTLTLYVWAAARNAAPEAA